MWDCFLWVVIAALVFELRSSRKLVAEWKKNAEFWEKNCDKYKAFIDNEASGWNDRLKEAGLSSDD